MWMMSDEARPKYNELRSRFPASGDIDWHEVISVCFPQAEFSLPATTSEFDAAAGALGRSLPDDLISFLRTSDGVVIDSVNLISPVAEVIDTNLYYRGDDIIADYMPFEHMLIFGSELNGDRFVFPIAQRGEYFGSVFLWNHETDCREFFAYSLLDFILRYRAYSGNDEANKP
jgi:SMI1 / KNR4 family (SUKH-1)